MYKESSYRNCETTLGKNTRFSGTLHCNSSLQIDGFFKGAIETKGYVGVGKEAVVEADIRALAASVSGKVKGNVHVKEKLELFSSAKVEGGIMANSIKFKDGVEIIGECEMIREPGMVDIFSLETERLKANLQLI